MKKIQKLVFPRNLKWFIGAMFLGNFGAAMAYPLMPIYITQELGATITEVGLIFTLASIVPIALQLVSGFMSDVIGRLPTIAIGAVIATTGYLGFIFAPTWQWFILALMLEYVSGSFIGPSYGAYISDQSTEENRGRIFGMADSLFLTVGIIGPPFGGFIVVQYGFEMMFVIAAISFILAAILRIYMVFHPTFKERQRSDPDNKMTMKKFKSSIKKMWAMVIGGGVITWILITDGVRDIGYGLTNSLEPIYQEQFGGLNEQDIGNLSAVSSIAWIGASLISGWLTDKFEPKLSIAIGFIIQFSSLMVFINAEAVLGFAIARGLSGAAFGFMFPAYDTLIGKVVPENMRGMAYGLFWTSMSIFTLPAPFLGSYMWEKITPASPFIIVAGMTLLVGIIAWFKLKPDEKDIDEVNAGSPA